MIKSYVLTNKYISLGLQDRLLGSRRAAVTGKPGTAIPATESFNNYAISAANWLRDSCTPHNILDDRHWLHVREANARFPENGTSYL